MSELCVWGVLVSLSLINSSFQMLTNIDVTCPLDWVQHPNYKNKCYRLGGSAVPYTSAPGGCQGLQNGSTVANIYNLEIHNFLIDGFLSPNHEYYTSLRSVGGEYVFTELNNEPLEDWNEWGTITGDTCTVYSNVGGIWFWHTNNCNQPCLYICEYIVPTPGVLPVVLIPVDSIPLSGRVEVFQPSMWGTLRDSGSKETVTIVCKDLGLLYDSGLQCTGADDCGTGRVWNEKVKCDVNSANMLDCLADAKPTSPKDHSKDTIARCKAQETTTSEVTTTVKTTAIENNITTLEVRMSTFGDITTHDEETTAIVTTEPITPQNNVTIVYYNFTHTVNVTVTEIITSYVTIVSSSTCLSVPSTSESLSYTTTSSTVASSTTAYPTTPHVPYVYEALPVVKAKNTAKYSTKTRQDYRASAQVLGSFGILIIVTILSVIVALDLGTLGKAAIRFCKKKKTHRNDSQGEYHERNSESDADSTFSTPRSLTNISINALAMKTYVKKKPSKNYM